MPEQPREPLMNILDQIVSDAGESIRDLLARIDQFAEAHPILTAIAVVAGMASGIVFGPWLMDPR